MKMISAFSFITVIFIITAMVSCQVNLLDGQLDLITNRCSFETADTKLITFEGIYYIQRTTKPFSEPSMCNYFQVSSTTEKNKIVPDAFYASTSPLNNDSVATASTVLKFGNFNIPAVNIIANNSDGIIVVTCTEEFKIPIPKVLVCTYMQHVNSSVINRLMKVNPIVYFTRALFVSNTQINCPQADQLPDFDDY